ncbi:Uncharacterized conserved protein (plasmid) [Tsukamurella tyrosinosolvens]|uniref:Uncharacterized protein, DUF1810 family n=1 Tax=Tsukamurella tyrosinosolvens TaxID=57704 RepID=A0A1H4VHF6_TSUTY|nr:DUF1810 family protein [Tsukamurella tyrosinosolvens]KXO91108.1 hypothetical protein AXK58_21405 [Tsukamurella tyrosinosolvens]SEC79804.1 Uncharacterized protein, DUF1810 family [Tsukamurella tyrosinosolvens]VEH90548.1 Uncharacterized conserved protein [Tsukamurella tyrosinosolvens]
MRFDSLRFRMASDEVWETVRRELRAGRKETHWIWFVFPQLTSLGYSSMATTYGLDTLRDAREYAADPVLGPRLREAFGLLLALPLSVTALEVLGATDAMKLRSCATLFAAGTAWTEPGTVLERFFGGEHDPRTVAELADAA